MPGGARSTMGLVVTPRKTSRLFLCDPLKFRHQPVLGQSLVVRIIHPALYNSTFAEPSFFVSSFVDPNPKYSTAIASPGSWAACSSLLASQALRSQALRLGSRRFG